MDTQTNGAHGLLSRAMSSIKTKYNLALEDGRRLAYEAATQIAPDDSAEIVLDVPVSTTQETPTMELQTEMTTKKARKSPHPTAKGAGPTAFSTYCKANKIDGAKARRALRAAGLRAPYDPKSKKVLDVLKAL